MTLKLPYNFDPQKIYNEYLKVIDENTNEKTFRHCAIPALKRMKKIANSEILNNDILKELDEKMLNFQKTKTQLDDTVASATEKNHTAHFRKIITRLFNYKFKSSNFIRIENNNMPLKLVEICESDSKIKEIATKFVDYVYKNKKSEKTKKNLITRAHLVFEQMKNDLIKNKITREILLKCIQTIEDNTKENIKTKDSSMESDSLNNLTKHIIRVVNTLIECYPIKSLKDIPLIKVTEINPKIKKIERIDKDYFKNDELDKLSGAYQNDRERLIFTLFLTTGIRVGGLVNLKVGYVFNEKFEVKKEGHTLEKGNKTRKFTIFLPLRQALEKYKNGDYKDAVTDLNFALFPTWDKKTKSFKGCNKAVISGTINALVKTVCKRAGLSGTHIHSHAFRKTVVIKLMEEGNTLDNVSKFIGHSNPTITAKSYWVPTQEDLIKNMKMSWVLNLPDIKDESTEPSTYQTTQIQRITTIIMEGMKAKERLQHALDLMTPEQLRDMEKKWTSESSDNVCMNTKDAIKEILESSSTISDMSSIAYANTIKSC